MDIAENKITMSPYKRITEHIASLTDWRGELLARLRKLILEVDPSIVEE